MCLVKIIMELLNITYDGEEICDIERAVKECFDHRFNPDILKIPTIEGGFPTGRFKVIVTWENENV